MEGLGCYVELCHQQSGRDDSWWKLNHLRCVSSPNLIIVFILELRPAWPRQLMSYESAGRERDLKNSICRTSFIQIFLLEKKSSVIVCGHPVKPKSQRKVPMQARLRTDHTVRRQFPHLYELDLTCVTNVYLHCLLPCPKIDRFVKDSRLTLPSFP